MSNVGIAIMKHPPFITINGWDSNHQKWVVCDIAIPTLSITGWWFQPSDFFFVTWDDYFQIYGIIKVMFQSPPTSYQLYDGFTFPYAPWNMNPNIDPKKMNQSCR